METSQVHKQYKQTIVAARYQESEDMWLCLKQKVKVWLSMSLWLLFDYDYNISSQHVYLVLIAPSARLEHLRCSNWFMQLSFLLLFFFTSVVERIVSLIGTHLMVTFVKKKLSCLTFFHLHNSLFGPHLNLLPVSAVVLCLDPFVYCKQQACCIVPPEQHEATVSNLHKSFLIRFNWQMYLGIICIALKTKTKASILIRKC